MKSPVKISSFGRTLLIESVYILLPHLNLVCSQCAIVSCMTQQNQEEHSLKWGFDEACTRAEIVDQGWRIIWHDLRRTFATRLRANGVNEYDIQDLLGRRLQSESGISDAGRPDNMLVCTTSARVSAHQSASVWR